MSPTIARPEHSHFRWTVCALLFFATTINYVDRQVLRLWKTIRWLGVSMNPAPRTPVV